MPRLRLSASREVFTCSYRWPSCHCASVIAIPGGQLLAVWYAGTYERAKDQAILIARCHSPAFLWESATTVVDTPGKADGNPVLWLDSSERLWLFYVTIFGEGWDECKVYAKCSLDGYTWQAPITLREELGWMLRAKPLTLADGTVLLPMYDERDWSSHVLLSKAGAPWRRFGHVTAQQASQGLIQPALVPLADGRVRMYMRTGGPGGFVWRSDSEDGGQTWSYPEPTALLNPNSGIDVLQLRSGPWLLAYNPSSSQRTPLSLALSEDEGASWQPVATVASGPGEFSYPTLAEDEMGIVHLLYTHKRLAIRHCAFEVCD
ncbi:MAG: sialidase family protein [Anaerolineae bacterium]